MNIYIFIMKKTPQIHEMKKYMLTNEPNECIYDL